MKIAVLLKPVPDLSNLSISKSQEMIFEKGSRVMNRADRNALEMALTLAEVSPGEVHAITLGESSHEPILREALAMGAHSAHLLVDEAFLGGDGWATSLVLTAALKKIGGFDLILCGDRVQPDLPGEIGGRLAEELGIPLISAARQIHYRNGEFWVTRGVSGPSTGDELREERLPLPAVIAVPEGANSPRMANAIKIMKASKASLNRRDAESLGIEGALAGESGSALRIRRTYLPGEE